MLNREEYNLAFKTTLSQEEFDEIMRKPITDFSEVEELVFADRKGNVWRFLPATNAIPIKWIENYVKNNFCFADWYGGFIGGINMMLEEWEKENGEQ